MQSFVFMRSPAGEVKEVAASTDTLTPLMAAGWHQVPGPVADQKPAAPAGEED